MENVTKRPIHRYSEAALKDALSAIRNGLGIREASRKYGVPRTTIQDRIHGRIKEGPRKMGPPTVLTMDEEGELVDWLKALAKTGFPKKKSDLLKTVQKIVLADKRETPFNNGKPGDKWYAGFLKRHPDLSLREPEGLTKARAIVTEEYIRKWFQELQEYITENKLEGIFSDPRRVLNGDETSFSMCPKTGKVLAPKGWKNVYEIKKGSDKETLTVLLVFSSAGATVPPMVVFPYTRPPASVVKSMPDNWFLGKSETGWMRSEVFYEYIVNGVNNWLEKYNVPKPVILFIDGHKSHLSMQLSRWCDENGIILYGLPPNTTHIMQPADVSVFKPLKGEWKKTVREWQSRSENLNSILTKTTFCPLLAECLNLPSLPETIINGFKRCGLYPLDPDAIDYSKCIQNKLEGNIEKPFIISREEVDTTKKVLLTLKDKLLLQDVDSDSIIKALDDVYQNIINNTQAENQIPETGVVETYEVQGEHLILLEVKDAELTSLEVQNADNEDQHNIEFDQLATNNCLEQREMTLPNTKQDCSNGKIDISAVELGTAQQNCSVGITACRKERAEDKLEIGITFSDKGQCSCGDKIMENLGKSRENTKKLELEQKDCDEIISKRLEREEDSIKETGQLVDVPQSSSENIKIRSLESAKETNHESGKEIEGVGQFCDKTNIIVAPNFKDHLFWPSPIKTKKKTYRERLPAAISSAKYRKYIEDKENTKRKLDEEKENRKRARQLRSTGVQGGQKKRIRKQKENSENASEEADFIGGSIKCASCDEELVSDVEEDDLKNIGCDNCIRWFHLMCTEFVGLAYEEVQNRNFICYYCS